MHICLIVLNAIGLLFGLYFFITSVLGVILPRKKTPDAVAPSCSRRIAAVIAARNEETVIGGLVDSLMAQDYPRELFDVYVVPNNCTDRTEAVARAHGARILTCASPVHTKGDALRDAFSQLSRSDAPYDAYCVFDADNLVDRGFFRAACRARDRGYRVSQGYRDSRNPFSNWISGSMSVFYWFMSRFYNTSRDALGMSCALNGTGFMVSDDLIQEIGWPTVTLTEDLEFSAICALHDAKIGWMPDARVYDEQPTSFRDSVMQRRRWSAGTLQCFRIYTTRLLGRFSSHAVDMGIHFIAMLLNLLGTVTFVLNAWIILKHVLAVPQSAPHTLLVAAVSMGVSLLAFSLFALMLYALEGKLKPRALPTILLFGLFMATWYPINLVCFFTRPPKWKAIRHTGGADEKGAET